MSNKLTKIKIFIHSPNIEEHVNRWLEEMRNKIEIKNITYTRTSPSDEKNGGHYVMVEYYVLES